jgi:hypothetical protein
MDLTQLTPAALTELIHLAEEKQAILSRIEKIDADLRALLSGNAAAPKATAKTPHAAALKPAAQAATKIAGAAPKAAAPVRAKRGALKEGILAALEAAGSTGAAVTQLAAQLGVEPANVHVWFATTGKKLSHITKIAPGRYAISAAAATAAPVAVVEAVAAAIESAPVTVVEVISAPAEVAAPIVEEVAAALAEVTAPVLTVLEDVVDRIVELDPVEESQPAIVFIAEEAPAAEQAAPVAEETTAPANEELQLASAQ